MLQYLEIQNPTVIEIIIHQCYFICISFNIIMFLSHDKLLVHNHQVKYLIPAMAIVYSCVCLFVAGTIFDLHVRSVGQFFNIMINKGLISIGFYEIINSLRKLKRMRGGRNE